ncbi:MAG TPA: glycine oxidase ThiO [Candidatus Aquilonibacter sp.]|nr:glycine oxidase ThiO [Candidatus Aquilonibacter sp.]
MNGSGDVAVLGGGVIGLAIAQALASRGATVRVFERDEPGRAASWAAAGMLAPYTERLDDEALLALCAQSLAMYPSFARACQEDSGVDVQLHLDGIVNAAFSDERLDELTDRARALSQRGIACELLDRSALLVAEPALGRKVLGALLLSGEGYVDNRRLGRALTAACERSGVTIVRDTEQLAIELDNRRVLGVRTHRGFTAARHVIVATGAWSASIPGLRDALAPPVTPVKGQMLALAAPRGFLKRTTWVPGAYLVPREDGRLLVGATVEHAGFDQRVTAEGVRALLDAALDAAPALGSFALTETWAGLRPATPDGRPILGPTGIDGLIMATGHYRNGILLTPITAQLIASFVETGDARPLEPWLLARFEKEGAAAKRMTTP